MHSSPPVESEVHRDNCGPWRQTSCSSCPHTLSLRHHPERRSAASTLAETISREIEAFETQRSDRSPQMRISLRPSQVNPRTSGIHGKRQKAYGVDRRPASAPHVVGVSSAKSARDRLTQNLSIGNGADQRSAIGTKQFQNNPGLHTSIAVPHPDVHAARSSMWHGGARWFLARASHAHLF